MRKRVHGRDERLNIGRFPDITVENARKVALQAKAQIAAGQDPTSEKKRLRRDITFGDMFLEFMERYSKRYKKTWQEDEREINKFASHWFKRKASQLRKSDFQALHEKIRHENGLYQANRVLERLRAIYNKAIEWGWEGQNPTLGIKKFKERSRDRFLRKDELPRFFAALAAEENEIARDYILMSLLTGARRGNVLAMRWQEINLQANTWRIPETKNGEAHTVPLSPLALEILQRREEERVNAFVFPGRGKSGHLADPKKPWQRIRNRAGLEDVRLHDLRRTLGSWMAAGGASTAIIGKTLAHKSLEATKIYERLDLDPVRESMESAQQEMLKAGGVQ